MNSKANAFNEDLKEVFENFDQIHAELQELRPEPEDIDPAELEEFAKDMDTFEPDKSKSRFNNIC